MIMRFMMKIYFLMQKYYPTFRIILWLRECGITRKVRYIALHHTDEKLLKHPSQDMLEGRVFFQNNNDRVAKLMSLLADQKSRDVWGGVVQYRTTRTPLPKDLYSENDQYFVEDIVQIDAGEVFVDGGAYTGDTIRKFMDVAGKKHVRYKRIIAFEPDEKNYQLLHKFYGNKKQIVLIKKGLSVKNEELLFLESGTASRLTEDISKATAKIQVINLDAIPQCWEATWIKMDIEGAEMDALHGAEKIIRRNHPKLTICIYHSNEDMIRIAEYIHELVPEYRMYIRHHTKGMGETVLYAVM